MGVRLRASWYGIIYIFFLAACGLQGTIGFQAIFAVCGLLDFVITACGSVTVDFFPSSSHFLLRLEIVGGLSATLGNGIGLVEVYG